MPPALSYPPPPGGKTPVGPRQAAFPYLRGHRYAGGNSIGTVSTLAEIAMTTVLLLTISNIFMTFAWYGHLKYKTAPLWMAILVSWGIAFFEYCFQVPANRIGHQTFSAAQLKIIQEVITVIVFCGFSVLYLQEPLRWNYIVGFLLVIAAVFFVFCFGPTHAASSH